jgi:hypothetical protein
MISALRQKVVFVDPEDPGCPFWWPALIVPKEFLHLFPSTDQSGSGGSDEIVVCYFEDGSFSVVPQTAIQPFSLKNGLYLKYKNDSRIGQAFLQDRAVLRATRFCIEGTVPQAFSWLTTTSNGSRAKEQVNAGEEAFSQPVSISQQQPQQNRRKKGSSETASCTESSMMQRKEYKMIGELLPPSRIAIVKSIIQQSNSAI